MSSSQGSGTNRRPAPDCAVEPFHARDNASSEPVQTRAPLSFPQQRLWFLEQLHPGTAAYTIPFVLRLAGDLRPDLLAESLATVFERHEVLHTRFDVTEGDPWQETIESSPPPLTLTDLATHPVDSRERELRRLIEQAAARPFRLTEGSNIRWNLYRLGEREHALFVSMHHIASDAASIGIFIDEAASCYESLLTGASLNLPDLPIEYADFAAWQRNRWLSSTSQDDRDYWSGQLGGELPVLSLPADKSRPAFPSFKGGRCETTLSGDLTAALKRLGMAEGVTPFMLLLAAFKAFLFRLTGSEDLLVGAPITSRQRNGTDRLIGFFSNTIVLRTRPSGTMPFREWLQQVRTVALEGYTHSELPFEKLVELLPLDRKLSHSPLFQTMFVLQAPYTRRASFGDLRAELELVDSGTAKFDLTLEIETRPAGWRVSMEYSADLFERSTVERWLTHFRTLLKDICESPAKRLCDLTLLSSAELEQQLIGWNHTDADYPRDECIHHWFERRAAETPDAIALEFDEGRLTYGELNHRADRVASYLIGRGTKPGSLIGVCIPQSHDLIVAMLGVLKSGAAYLPLDASLPEERIRFMLEDARVPVVLTTQQNARLFSDVEAVCVELIPDSHQRVTSCASQISADSPAYAIYTSGSTGSPKGVVVPHRAVMRLVLNTDYIKLLPTDRIAQVSNTSFDAATFEIWGALLNGSRLVGIPRDVVLAPHEFSDALRRKKISALFLTTSLFNQMAFETPDAFEHVGTVLFGGEAADPRAVNAVLSGRRPKRLLNVYGPTENTTFSTWFEISDVRNRQAIPIGRPISNSECYVLDGHLQPVPIGVEGELYVGGDGLAQGYLNRRELTRERFISHPFKPGERLYRTGDRVRYLPDSNIEFLGRSDDQVKIRGFRVEPGEVESAFLQHTDVGQCVVTTRPDSSGVRQLLAFVVGRAGAKPRADELGGFIRSKLPDYMIPSRIFVVDRIPLSATGKADRNALLLMASAPQCGMNVPAPPSDQLERELQAIWQEVLQIPQIDVHEGFFAIGGHSLLAVKIIARVEKVLKKKLTVAELFQHSSIEQLAAHLRTANSSKPESSIIEIQGGGSKPPLFLVHGIGGGMLWGYANLARNLGSDWPVYAFQAADQDETAAPLTIEALADKYLNDLRRFRPRGPYCLGGYCFGGIIAYEMACRLREKENERADLILFNSCPPNSAYTNPKLTPETAVRFLWNAGRRTASLFRASREQRMRFMRWKAGAILKRISRSTTTLAESEASIDHAVDLSAIPAGEQNLWREHLRALKCYRPRPFDGRLILYRSPHHLFFCSFDPGYGWDQFVPGRISVKVCFSRHETIMQEPAVMQIAEHLKTFLEQTSGATDARHGESMLQTREALA